MTPKLSQKLNVRIEGTIENKSCSTTQVDSKTFFGSNHVAEQLLFSIVPSIPTFDFDLILGSFLTFWGPNGLFFGPG